MTVIALRQLTGDYGTVPAGQTFDVADETGNSLLQRGLVRLATPPRVLYYDTKVITPEAPEVSPRPLFRDLSLSDAKSPAMAPASHPVLSGSDLPVSGTPNPGRRRGRA